MSSRVALGAFLSAAALVGCSAPHEPTVAESSRDPASAQYVGGESCARCHSVETSYWAGSHHDLAMQEPSELAVLGDFDDASFDYAGVTSRFFRSEGRFWVATDGPDGEITEYPIRYVFGAVPLQQYLIEFPDGRLQALSICWDTRPAAEGGQRWFHLYPDEAVDHTDELHWTRPAQNWNFMCAECHSTNLEKNYRAESDAYETTYSEIDVGCEACHGPGSDHVAWADAMARGEAVEIERMGLVARLKDPGRGTWIVGPETGKGLRLGEPVDTDELDVCARCHSRRGAFSGDYRHGRPIGDTHRVAFLDEGLYHADGQILDEVYVHGSYLQSKMHRAGVTCSDCHEPHALGLLFPGDKVCARCHTASLFESREHHFHEPGKEGSRCVDCHMPPRNYMVVDPRHDHSLRIPRPDLTLETGAPNACSECHDDQSVEWSLAAFERWYGDSRMPGPDPRGAIRAARVGAVDAEVRLMATIEDPEIAGIVRATAASLLGGYLSPRSLGALERALVDGDPLVRRGVAASLASLPPEPRVERGARLLADPVREVRMEAARALAGVPTSRLSGAQQGSLSRALEEYRAAQRFNAERPEAWANLGTLEATLGNLESARGLLERALAIDPDFVPAYINLADVYRMQQRDEAGEEILQQGLARAPGSAPLRHALGLLYVRLRETARSLEELEQAATLAPDQTRYAYVFAIALHSAGATPRALTVLEEAHRRAPADRSVLQALATIHRDLGDFAVALSYARRLFELSPGDPAIRQLIAQLERAAG